MAGAAGSGQDDLIRLYLLPTFGTLPASPLDTEPLDTEPLDTKPLDTEPLDTEPLERGYARPHRRRELCTAGPGRRHLPPEPGSARSAGSPYRT